MKTAFRVLSLLPLRLLHAIGWLLGWVVFVCSAQYRRRFKSNVAQAGLRFADVRAAVGHAGRMGAEMPKIWMGKPQSVVMGVQTRQLLDDVRESPRGVLFFTPHIGCFELSAQAVSLYWQGARGPLTVLYRPSRKQWLAEWMKTARDRFGVEAVPTDLGGVRAMLKSLRKGGCVGLLPDQVPPYGLGVWAPFFGKPAYTMTMAAKLIQQTNPIVLVARCERLPKGQGYELFMEPLEMNAAAGAAALVLRINQAMEAQIRQCPQQYLWGYARYKRPRGMPDDEPVTLATDDGPRAWPADAESAASQDVRQDARQGA